MFFYVKNSIIYLGVENMSLEKIMCGAHQGFTSFTSKYMGNITDAVSDKPVQLITNIIEGGQNKSDTFVSSLIDNTQTDKYKKEIAFINGFTTAKNNILDFASRIFNR